MSQAVQQLEKKLLALRFITSEGEEQKPTSEQVKKMIALCQKRSSSSYYKLCHAAGVSEAYRFKGIDMYSDDGKKMRRFESGL